MTSWKTSLAGIALIVGTIANAIYQFAAHNTPPDLVQLTGAVTAGVGLIAAKDHNVSNAQFPLPPKAVIALLVTGAVLLSGVVSITITGCANSAADKDIRRKVQEVDVNVAGTYDPATNGVGGTINNRIILRDPDAAWNAAHPDAGQP